jgi:membrane-associated phospholipid phosphatase
MRTLVAAIVTSSLLVTPVFAQSTVTDRPPASPLLTSATPAAGLAAPTPLPSVASLFRDLGNDFRRLPSREAAIILGAAGGASLAIRGQDAPITRNWSTSPALDGLFEPGATVGGGAVQFGGALATFALGRTLKSPRISIVGADLVRAQIVGTVLTQGIKVSTGRQRPDGTRFSFPSGHTSSSFATAAVLQRHFGWKAGIPAYGLAAFVAGSRLQENRHYMSDVIFGAAVGIVSGRAVTVGRGRGLLAVAPFAVRGGGGIGFTLIGSQ